MKALSGGLTFFNFATVCALILGWAAGGLGHVTAALSLFLGLLAGLAAYFATNDDPADTVEQTVEGEDKSSSPRPASRRHGPLFWTMAGIFALFAFRSFCWLLYVDNEQLMIQSPNNLGDISLHVTYIGEFANGAPLWPANPIWPVGHLRYPAGVDLFNSLLLLVHVDLIKGLVWVGLLASLATFYALYRWGGLFTVAAFLFNGGIVGFQSLGVLWREHAIRFFDYQGDKTIAWKSVPLTMFVTQRGLLYAVPAGLLLLWQWRCRYFRKVDEQPPLPFWVEVALYATMPLFHVHTFLALSIVLAALFICGNPTGRGQLVSLVAASLLPASALVYVITDHFAAGGMLGWHPGWVLSDHDFGRSSFIAFWWINFGILIPLLIDLYAVCSFRAWKSDIITARRISEDIAFLFPAALIIILTLLLKFAPWEWDNLKLMIWAYLILMPFLWTEIIRITPTPLRVALCVALFGSGFVSLFGGLAAGRPGLGLANREEVDYIGAVLRGESEALGAAVEPLPEQARFAAYPTYNHPLLLLGREVALGYPGHLWTQGYKDHVDYENRLTNLMMGRENWQQEAQALGVRYIFWGHGEIENYEKQEGEVSRKPWEHLLAPIYKGEWCTIYDLQQLPSFSRAER